MPDLQRPPMRGQLKASLWMLVGVATLILIALSARELSRDLPVLQILFLRNSVGFPFLLAGVLIAHGPSGFRTFRTGSFKLQLARNAVQAAAQAGWIYSLAVLPLATVFAIEYSQPLWAILLGALFLAEHPHRWQKWGVAIGFAGVLVIARPGSEGFSLGALVMLGASVLYAGVYLTTRMLGRTDSALALPFWTSVIQAPITLLLALPGWQPITAEHWPWIAAIGLGSLVQQYCMAAALRLAPMAHVIPIDYLRLPVIAVIGAAYYAEAVDPVAMAGAVVVIGGVLLTQRRPPVTAPGK